VPELARELGLSVSVTSERERAHIIGRSPMSILRSGVSK
jgi:hypothetical protein